MEWLDVTTCRPVGYLPNRQTKRSTSGLRLRPKPKFDSSPLPLIGTTELHHGEFVPASSFKVWYRVLKVACYAPRDAHSRSLHQSTYIAAAVPALAAPMVAESQKHSVGLRKIISLRLSGKCSL
ncbi:hypothetical protein ABVK25_005511 [Lepraria finkii]|uniref:Uncharacterized protein n=1 Tax=Lepraria finkii TaxID=1340010 RepID=A0ABR4B9F6_9LECA